MSAVAEVRLPERTLSAVAADRSNEPTEREAGVSYKAEPIYVRIKRNGVDVTDTTQDVIVGERIRLTAEVQAAGLPVSGGVWTIPGYAISNWTAGPQSATIWPLNSVLDQPNVNFVWVDANQKMVTYGVTIDGVGVTAIATFNVDRPVVQMIANPTGTVTLDDNYVEAGGQMTLHYGGSINTDPNGQIISGIEFFLPPAIGEQKFQIVQLIADMQRRVRDAGGWQRRAPTSGLDVYYPYPLATATSTNDSPVQGVTEDDLEATINENFSTWLMFKPYSGEDPFNDMAAWVPISVVNWGWSGHALRQGTEWVPSGVVGQGDLVAANHFPTTQTSGTDTTNYPLWVRNVKPFWWVNE